MADAPEFDLKFLPDWLKEDSPASSKYADAPGEQGGEGRGRFSRQGGGPRRDDRGRGGPRNRDAQRGDRGPRRGGGRDDRRQRDRDQGQRQQQHAPSAPAEPLPVQVEFIPEEHTISNLVKEIKVKFNAYPVFTLARIFLERPKSHRVRIVSNQPEVTLHQAGPEGAIASDPRMLERKLFEQYRQEYYEEKVIEKEAIKGNFTNVARCKLSGILIGPTNHHSFQPTLRRIYEDRFSRRMSFDEYRRDIEVLNDAAAVEKWKEESRRITVFQTKKEAHPLELQSLAEAHRHFREHYQPKLMFSGKVLEVSGTVSRETPDNQLLASIRQAWETESRFPAHVVSILRSKFMQEGLHIFKHRKRIIFASAVRPTLFTGNLATLAPGIAKILEWIKDHPGGNRKQLAEALLPHDTAEEELNKAKSHLATDLRWLVHAGHVIEFQNGTLDLPLPPKPKQGPQGEKGHGEPEDEQDEVPAVAAKLAEALKPAPLELESKPAEQPPIPAAEAVAPAPPVPAQSAPSEAAENETAVPIPADPIPATAQSEPSSHGSAASVEPAADGTAQPAQSSPTEEIAFAAAPESGPPAEILACETADEVGPVESISQEAPEFAADPEENADSSLKIEEPSPEEVR